MANAPLVEVEGLTKSYGKFQALHNVYFNVEKGDVFGFLGPNGAGKSTSLRILLGLIRHDGGNVKLFGHPLGTHRSAIMRRVGCIVEKPDFYKYLSARKNLEIFGRMAGADVSRRKLEGMLDFVGLHGRGGDKLAGFSHGMRQRLGLAQALLHEPDLIVLDEPTTGLDPQGIIDMRELILRLSREQGKTVILSSHLLSEIEIIANRMVVINKGRTVQFGAVSDLLNANELVVHLETGQPDRTEVWLREKGFPIISRHDAVIALPCNRGELPALNAALVAEGIDVFALESRRKLEDYFLQLVNQA